jgi:O-antigen/teichoic acid export membrane protein
MNNRIKKLAGDTVLYGLGSIVPRALNFLLVRLHTDVFLPADYGIITKLFAYAAVINIVLMLGMETAFFRFATKALDNKQRIFNIAQSYIVVVSILFCGLVAIYAHPIATYMQIPDQPEIIYWLACILFLDAIVAIPFANLRLEKKPLKFATGKLSNIIILVGLNYYFLKIAYNPNVGVGYVILANLIANATYLLFFAPELWHWRPTYDRTLSKQIFLYAYPIMFMGLAGMTNEMFSRLTLEWWLPENFYEGKSSEYALGVFGACYKFAILMNLTIQAFRYAAEPFFFSNAADKNSPELFAKINHYFIIVCCFILLTVSINLDILKHFLKSSEYWEGLGVVPILMTAYLFTGIYYNLSVWFKVTDRTHYGTLLTTMGAIITIVANFILIPYFGYIGSSWATVICYVSMTVVSYLLGQRYYPVPYYVKKGLAYILGTLVIIYITNEITFSAQWITTAFHTLIICACLILVFFMEKQNLRKASI